MKNLFKKDIEAIERVLEPMRKAQPRVGLAAGASAEPGERDTNPYLEARREWNERYGTYIIQASNWRKIALLCGITALSSVGGLAYIATQTKVVPYVVQVDRLGEAQAAGFAEQAQPVDPRVIRYALGNFVTWWRSLTPDRVVHKQNIQKLYAMVPVGSPAVTKLNEQFRAKSPFKEAEESSATVQLLALLPISGQTWQVEWMETHRDPRGELLKKIRFKATVTVNLSAPTTEGEVTSNPLGVFVRDFNFTQQI
ncbi:MAG TPA: VirB8/TrbF family protein [Ramlibacter sp.]|uniref:VirB8/TrbF family protein n=1 Tax=Ramlibacter sp. TaxID=1917967 RepID=UPI002C4BB3D0|nr:VirB8/TrbF family protein [Ramlibacter sp.]HVZ42787.1 VirB8/TrbF family protein [Ramlibacter sp.]